VPDVVVTREPYGLSTTRVVREKFREQSGLENGEGPGGSCDLPGLPFVAGIHRRPATAACRTRHHPQLTAPLSTRCPLVTPHERASGTNKLGSVPEKSMATHLHQRSSHRGATNGHAGVVGLAELGR
jgi:hypothetical protein